MKKQHSTEKAKKNTRPVSEKFYQSINERAIAAANVMGNPLLGVDVMMAVDDYINDGLHPSGRSVEVTLIFTILKPEIDKAITRSAAARKRRKRPATEAESQKVDIEAVKETGTDAITTPLAAREPEKTVVPDTFIGNRRERRRQEQEQRRLAKRLQRRRQ